MKDLVALLVRYWFVMPAGPGLIPDICSEKRVYKGVKKSASLFHCDKKSHKAPIFLLHKFLLYTR